MANPGFIYILTNLYMPGLIKIGKTTQEDVRIRVDQLYNGNTSVPWKFEIAYAVKGDDITAVENALHTAFDTDRVNSRREFFAMDIERVKAVLKLLAKEDVTVEVLREPDPVETEPVDPGIRERITRRRPPLNFHEMGITDGSELQYLHGDARATVIGEKRVVYNNEEYSLTKLTQKLMGLDYSVQPTTHWAYNGRNLIDIYNETYTFDDE